MADALVRLKFDSKEYDAKIERARKGLLDFEESLQKAGKSFKDADAEQVKFVQQLGNFQTVARTAKGQVAELTKAYTDLKLQYDKLSEADKSSDFGKGLSASLDTLKTRIIDSKKELADINRELGDTKTESGGAGSALDALTSKFGLSTKQLVGWGAAIGAAKAALDVAKDAFFASEQNLDEWNRTVYTAQSTYQGFLTALNTGDVSGFLSNIQQIVNAATEAYNAVDRLQTLQNIQAPKVAAKQSEIQRMETMLRTGRYVAPIDGRKGSMADGAILSDAQKKQIAENLASAMREIAALTKNEVKASNDAIDKLYREQALRLRMSNEEFKKGTASMAAFEANLEKARKAQEWEEKNMFTYTGAGGVLAVGSGRRNPYEEYKGWSVFKDDGDLYQRIIQLIQQRSSAESQYYGQMSRAYRGINRAEGGGGGGGKGNKLTEDGIQLGKWMVGLTDVTIVTYESMEDLQRQLTAYKTALNRATNAIDEQAARQGIAATEWKMSDVGRSAAKLGWSKEDMTSEVAKMQDALGNIEPLEIKAHIEADTKGFATDAAEMAKEWNSAGKAINAVGAAMSQIEDPAAKVMGTIAQAIATIALTFAQSLGKSLTVWDWIAGAATGTATMISTIAAIKSATSGGFASGGIIPGNSYSGDNLRGMTPDGNVYGLNAGELILNKAQQNNLASDLQRNDQNGATAQPYVSGEQIYLGLNNYLKSSGRGEIVTSRR